VERLKKQGQRQRAAPAVSRNQTYPKELHGTVIYFDDQSTEEQAAAFRAIG
jgi:hypothetical protein